MKNLLVLFLIAIATTVTANTSTEEYTTSCLRNLDESQRKVEQLKVQNLCSNTSNLDECRMYLGFGSLVSLIEENQESQSIPVCQSSAISSDQLSIAPVGILKSTQEISAKIIPILDESITRKASQIQNLEDFYHHTRLHKRRVVALGLYLFDQKKELFPGLSREVLKKALEVHDDAKVLPQYTDKHGRPFYQALYEDGFGRRPPDELIEELNSSDKKIMEEKLAKLGLSDTPDNKEKRAMIKYIEQLADFTDRGMAKVTAEEFGREMTRASVFMRDPKDAAIVRELLEKNYSEITEGLNYKRLSDIERSLLARKMAIKKTAYLTRSNPKWLRQISANSRVASAMGKSRGIYLGAKAFASKAVNRSLAAFAAASLPLEGALLAMYSPKVECASSVFLDFDKENSCQPIPEMTPRLLEFLYETEPKDHKYQFSNFQFCDVFEKIHKETIKHDGADIICRENKTSFKINYDESVTVEHDNSGVKRIYVSGLSRMFEPTSLGKVSQIIFDKGKLTHLCFESIERTSLPGELNCMEGDEVSSSHYNLFGELEKAQNFVKFINFKLNKAIGCCSGESSDLFGMRECSNQKLAFK